MDEKTSHKDWALERVRQEALAIRDERYRKNVWAVVLILAVLVVDPFSGVGGLIGSAIGQAFPESRPRAARSLPSINGHEFPDVRAVVETRVLGTATAVRCGRCLLVLPVVVDVSRAGGDVVLAERDRGGGHDADLHRGVVGSSFAGEQHGWAVEMLEIEVLRVRSPVQRDAVKLAGVLTVAGPALMPFGRPGPSLGSVSPAPK